jgi:hypothetical protein
VLHAQPQKEAVGGKPAKQNSREDLVKMEMKIRESFKEEKLGGWVELDVRLLLRFV